MYVGKKLLTQHKLRIAATKPSGIQRRWMTNSPGTRYLRQFAAYFFSMTSMPPRYLRSTSGITMEPSAR